MRWWVVGYVAFWALVFYFGIIAGTADLRRSRWWRD